MLPIQVLSDARASYCELKITSRITQRDLKLGYFQTLYLCSCVHGAFENKQEYFIMCLMQQEQYTRTFADVHYYLPRVFKNKCFKIIKFAIRRGHMTLQFFHDWTTFCMRVIDDVVVSTTVKLFAQKGFILEEIFPNPDFIEHLTSTSKKGGSLATILLLFKLGLNINNLPTDGKVDLSKCLLQYAINSNCLKLVKIMIQQGLTIEHLRSDNNQALIMASTSGYVNILRFLIQDAGLTIDDIRSQDCLAFRNACVRGHLPVVQFLVEQGLTFQDISNNNYYIIQYSTFVGHTRVAKYLHEKFKHEFLRQDVSRIKNT